MTVFSNIKHTYQKKEIDGFEFIKMTTKDTILGLVDILIFHKVNNKYVRIEQSDLPQKYILEISQEHGYKPLSIPETYEFENSFEKSLEKIKELNDVDTRMSNIFGTYYTVGREPVFFTINPVEINEFFKIKDRILNLNLVPYIMCDLIELNSKYNDNLFLVQKNLFVQLSNFKRYTLCTFIKVDDETGKCEIIQIYKIMKENNKYQISLDIKEDGIESLLKKEIKKFIDKLESIND